MTAREVSSPGSGLWREGAHLFRVRVYYEDTDAGGIVYHANYLNFAERARTEMLRLVGAEQDEMRREAGLGFTVRHCQIDFKAPARLDDLLEVRTVLREARGARVLAVQSLHPVIDGVVDPRWIVQLELTLACVNNKGRPTRLPKQIRAAFVAVSQTQ